MPNLSSASKAELDKAFLEYERPFRVANYKLGCLLAMVFMPGGGLLDYCVYGTAVMERFLPVRFGSAALLGLIWLALHRFPQTRWYRYLGFSVALIPQLSIVWMVYDRDGAQSTYYAGLNLVMLGAAILLRWTLMESIVIFIITLTVYGIATLTKDGVVNWNVYFSHIYFLTVTGIFVAAGTWYYNRIRYSEFELRHRLSENRAELEVANARLAESFNQLEVSAAKLEENNQKLRELDEVKSRFFALVSHELRTPLTLLIAPVEALMSRGERMDRAEMFEMLGTMHGNSMRLLKLINDLLDLVRLESGQIILKRRPVEIASFVSGLANAVTGVAKDKRINLKAYCEPGLGSVMADSEKLERICLNLLFNALKFTPSAGTVEFNAVKEGEMLRLEVRDSGVGISAENLPNIFNRFWQADTSSQRKYQGMGIGLALVKELAEAHGGGVEATSELGRGTVMAVRLPIEECAPGTKTADEEEAELPAQINGTESQEWISDLYRRAERFPAMTSLQATLRPVETDLVRKGGRPKLLIADDEPDMLRFLRSQLSANFDVIEAVDGKQALEKAAQFLPDIILSDMMMPEKDGLQVCRELRQRTSTRLIPVVLLTARADEKTKLDCLAAGANDFVAKPFSLTEVSIRLKNLVDNHLYQRELALQKQRLEAALEQVKETEALLVRNEKLASLGRLSAGLIHEINNPLNYAKQGLYVLRSTSQLLPDGERAEYAETLSDIENGVDRVARIIADLRSFTRTTHEVDQVFDLKAAVETTLRFFSHEFKTEVAVSVDIPNHTECRGDRNQIVQVIINLIQNALDAMRVKEYPDGQSPQLVISADCGADTLRLKIRDNGPGIPDDVMGQIFDPFFTTKDVGAGMGLGLSICHQIVAEHGGRIEVHSTLGESCEFVLEFPSVPAIMPS
jgi:signal transduction histidine kinase